MRKKGLIDFYILEILERHANVEAIAQKTFFSSNYFSRIFCKYVKETQMEY